MGIELAKAFAKKGATVKLILGPSKFEVNNTSISVQRVTTAEQMHSAIISSFSESDIAVMAAAVADFTPKEVQKEKIKKADGKNSIQLTPTKDILKELGVKKTKQQLLIGFSLETENEKENAISKLGSKNLDLIVLNSLKDKGAGFEFETNKVSLISSSKKIIEIPLKLKSEIAKDIVTYIEKELISE